LLKRWLHMPVRDTAVLMERQQTIGALQERYTELQPVLRRLSIRLPIGVTVQSSTEASVLSVPPARFWVISRLRPHIRSITMERQQDSIIMDAATRRNLEITQNLAGGSAGAPSARRYRGPAYAASA
jgi:hypothetical protein